MDISPEKPFFKEITLPQGIKEKDLKLSLFSSAGEELITYRPMAKKGTPMPEPVEAPPPPQEIKTIEELYFTAQRLEQFHNAALDPDPYYEEALTRDPGDYRVNTALGILYCKRGLFKEAEEKLRTAIKRITRNHTKPRDGEAYYYLGVACKAQGHYDEAYEAFYKATWSHAWYSAGFYSLAELAALKRDFPKALEFLERSISTNALNNKALNLKAAVLRRLGRYEEAVTLASRVLAMDPLDFREGDYQAALADFEAAGEYPENLEVGRPLQGGPSSQVYYFIATVYEALGDSMQASTFTKNRWLKNTRPLSSLIIKGWLIGNSVKKSGRNGCSNTWWSSGGNNWKPVQGKIIF